MPVAPWGTSSAPPPISTVDCGSWAIQARDTAVLYKSVRYIIPRHLVPPSPPSLRALLNFSHSPEICAFHYFLNKFTFAMSRTRFPPTPAMSGEFIIKDQPADATDAFALPPAALGPSKIDDPYSRRSSQSDPSYVPASPTSPDLMARNRSTQQSRSGNATKRSLEDFDLPPPPTRTRKIIQMKPKPQSATKSPSKPKENGKAQTSPESNAKDTAPKKKQPSATSAAGRKIARKTAHSLIERRRRSKMNEEFGTLKDMIPACTGQEMHKLAILQVIFHRLVIF